MVLVVYSDHDLHTSGHTGSAGNQPEERKRLVSKSLRETQKCTFHLVLQPESSIIPLGLLVHDEGMLQFLDTVWNRWEKEWNTKPNEHLKGVFCNETSDVNSKIPPPFIAGFFAPREVGQKPTKNILGQACYYSMDKETPIHSSTLISLQWDLAVTKEAVKKVKSSHVVYAQITHPGHHAGIKSYGGFCFINHAAIAVRLLQQKEGFQKVALVDVDYHAGNGSMSIFWEDPTVFFASLHGDPEYEYPFNCGFTDQIGGLTAQGTTMNIPLPGGTDWKLYKSSLLRVMDAIKKFGAQALVVSLGVDTLRGDPVALPRSRFNLEPKDYKEMGQLLLGSLNLPTIVIQEGGYKLDEVPLAVTAFLTGHVGGTSHL